MKVFLPVIVVCLVFACSRKSSPYTTADPPPVSQPAPGSSVKTWLALGDSYTIGQSVKVEERFPAQTVAMLQQEAITVGNPDYIAQTGWTTVNLHAAISAQAPAAAYDVVTLLIGVNDQYQRLDTGGYALRFEQLLQVAIHLAKGLKEHVFVLSIPDYSATPFVAASDKQRVRAEVDAFNRVNRRITEQYSVSYIDITPSSREAANNLALVAGDGLHPSGLEYKKWASLLAPKMKPVLQ